MKLEQAELLDLIRRSRQGDPEAQEALILAAQNKIYYHCKKILKHEEDAQDATQDVLIVMITSLDKLKEPAAFWGWVNGITANRCRHLLSSPHKEWQIPEDEEGNSMLDSMENLDEQLVPEKALDNEETRRMILGLVDDLPPEQRMSVLFYYYDEMSVKDIAAAMETSEGTVKSRLNYARRAIKNGVEDYERKGIKLYSASPILLLVHFLRQEAAGSVLDGAAAAEMAGRVLAQAGGALAAGTAAAAEGSAVSAAAGTAAAGGAEGAAAATTAAAAAEGAAAGTAATVGNAAAAAGAAVKAGISTKLIAGVLAGAVAVGGAAAGISSMMGTDVEEPEAPPAVEVVAPEPEPLPEVEEPEPEPEPVEEPEPEPEPEYQDIYSQSGPASARRSVKKRPQAGENIFLFGLVFTLTDVHWLTWLSVSAKSLTVQAFESGGSGFLGVASALLFLVVFILFEMILFLALSKIISLFQGILAHWVFRIIAGVCGGLLVVSAVGKAIDMVKNLGMLSF